MPIQRLLAPADLSQLKTQAKELRRAFRSGDRSAREVFAEFHPHPPSPSDVKLSDAQLVMARQRDFPSWPRLVDGLTLFNAICADDADAVEALLRAKPHLADLPVNGGTSNWGEPLACAAQVGAGAVLDRLLAGEPGDLQHALDRAILKGRRAMARTLIKAGARPEPGLVMGPCESLNIEGLRFLAEIGAPLTDEHGDRLAPVALLLEGYHRDPPGKHACLAFFEDHGIALPDTPVMALHRGDRLRLEALSKADPALADRRVSYRDIYPRALGCHEDESLGLHGTPLDGGGLLHLAMDFDELEIAELLLAHGADPNLPADRDARGFGGHTPLFNAVVSQAARTRRSDRPVRLLLDAGADPDIRADIRKAIRFHDDESEHLYRDVTALDYARRFHAPAWVNQPGAALLEQHAGARPI